MRNTVRARLAQLSDEDKQAASGSILGHLKDSEEWRGAQTVMIYLADESEPDLDELIEDGLAAGKLIAAPRINRAAKSMSPRMIRDRTEVELWLKRMIRKPARSEPSHRLLPARTLGPRDGIRHPKNSCAVVPSGSIDLVLVPGLAFDAQGGRLGRGGGYYDRFLSELPRAVHTIGVCFEIQRVQQVPVSSHDAGVSMLVTEAGVTSAG